MKSKMTVLWAAVLLAVLFQAGGAEAVLYKFTDLEQGFPNDPGDYVTAINDASQIVGYYDDPIVQEGYFYDPVKRSYVKLQPLSGTYPKSKPYGINKLGQIVGACSNSNNTVFVACVWTSPAAAPTMLSQLATYTSGYAYSINDNGLIVGCSYNSADSQQACKWTIAAPGQPVGLGTLGGMASVANWVNNTGQIVGWAHNDQGFQRACLWNAGQITGQDLAASLPNGSTAKVINNQGNVMGQANTGLGRGKAFFWDHLTGGVQEPTDLYDTWAIGLGDDNQMVGDGGTIFPHTSPTPWYWTPGGGVKDLNQMIANLPPGLTVNWLTLMGPKGNILGAVTSVSYFSSCLLTPVASSPANNLLLLD
jgi:probable HAF family extracellular repeat protein